MTIDDEIRARKSVRSYSGTPLGDDHREQVKRFISSLGQPLGGSARIELVSAKEGREPAKMGTYGVISGAQDYLLLLHDESGWGGVNAGYLFEQAVLYCTGLGLGTCWIGGTFKAEDFASKTDIGRGEVLRIISPVGYPAPKERFLDKVMRAGAGSSKRKPFGELFFAGDISTPLTPADPLAEPLEMVRLAPSARNLQPWRAIVTGEDVHFYFVEKSRFNDIDMGIALCHFGESCKAKGIGGHFETVPEGDRPVPGGMKYSMSWISGRG